MPAHKLANKEFEWTPKLAYAVGLLATDGNLSKDGRHIVMRSTDIQLLDTFKNCINASDKIAETFNDSYGKKRMYRIQSSKIQLYRWLLKIGLTPAKTYTLGTLAIPDRYFNDFLRGHLDGDGSITIYKDYYNTKENPKYIYDRLWLRFISASEPHLIWLRTRIFELTGSKGHIWADKQRNRPNTVPMHVIKFGKKDSIKLLNWMYYDSNIPCLLRKLEKAKPFLSWTFPGFAP